MAGTFLTTDATEKAALYQRYRDDLVRARPASPRCHGTRASSGRGRRTCDTLTTQIPIYSGLIETARTNDRLGNPVGTAYLGEARQPHDQDDPARRRSDLYQLQRRSLAQGL